MELIMGSIEDIEKNTPLNPPLIGGQDPIPPWKRGLGGCFFKPIKTMSSMENICPDFIGMTLPNINERERGEKFAKKKYLSFYSYFFII